MAPYMIPNQRKGQFIKVKQIFLSGLAKSLYFAKTNFIFRNTIGVSAAKASNLGFLKNRC